jgi:hypothetical protein
VLSARVFTRTGWPNAPESALAIPLAS